MNLLFDTHAFLWWATDPGRLPEKVLALIQAPENRLLLSTASTWEAQIKIGLGKLTLKTPLHELVAREIRGNALEVLPIMLHHTWRLAELPSLHRDPFDRLLIAQALEEKMTLVSGDPLIQTYPGLEFAWT